MNVLLPALICVSITSTALAQTAADQTRTQEPAQATGGAVPAGPPGWLFPVGQLNERLPHWLRFGGEYRARVDGPDGIKFSPTSDWYLLSRLRLDLTIQPTDWLQFFAQGQDSHVFFNQHVASAMPYQDRWDIRQAYVQIGSPDKGWANLAGGRQVLAFGDERVIGPSDWVNEGRTFDAIRLDLHKAGYKVSLFASSVVVGRDGVIDHHIQGNDLYGAYGSIKNLIPHGTVEPYVFWRLAPGNAGLGETAHRGHLSEVTPGLRAAGSLAGGFDYNIEMDVQRGMLGPDSISAWAGYWNFGRSFRGLKTAPRLFVEANYATGNKNPAGTTWSTFDQIYPSGHNKLDFADLVGRKNVEQIRAGVRETAGRKWKLYETYEDLWLATTKDALYSSSGAISVAAHPAVTSRHIGRELDLWAEFEMTRGVSGGFGYARLFAGQFLKAASTGKDYSYPFLYLTYRFQGR